MLVDSEARLANSKLSGSSSDMLMYFHDCTLSTSFAGIRGKPCPSEKELASTPGSMEVPGTEKACVGAAVVAGRDSAWATLRLRDPNSEGDGMTPTGVVPERERRIAVKSVPAALDAPQ